MATISEVTDTISKQLLNLVKRIERLEKEVVNMKMDAPKKGGGLHKPGRILPEVRGR